MTAGNVCQPASSPYKVWVMCLRKVGQAAEMQKRADWGNVRLINFGLIKILIYFFILDLIVAESISSF